MNYVIYGIEQFLIDKELKKIVSNINQNNITKYDLENTKIETIIEDANLVSLFDDKKFIIVDNAYIFTGTTNKKLLKQNTEVLEKYLNNPNPSTILVFVILKEKLDIRKKIYKLIKQNGKLIECNKSSSIQNVVKSMLDGYNIDNNCINLLINRVGTNLAILEQECNKIKTYKGDELIITENDIISLTSKIVDTDLFHLIDNIVSKNKKEAIESYHEMITQGEEPIMILINLANQFRIIYQVKQLSKQGYSEIRIADYLQIHSYRVKKAFEKRHLFSDSQLLKYIKDLADLDYDIKSGKIDKEIGLELFIINA